MSHFYAVLSRMKYINRWGLMRNTRDENLSEHSLEVAIIAHALAIIKNERLNGSVNAEHIAVLAMFHDAPEIFTGDLPTPVKYFNPAIKNAYKEVEKVSATKLLSYLPPDLKPHYDLLLLGKPDEDTRRIIKAADKISALIKCVEEQKAGNREFNKAHLSLVDAIRKLDLKEADIFVSEFLPSFELTLDELE